MALRLYGYYLNATWERVGPMYEIPPSQSFIRFFSAEIKYKMIIIKDGFSQT